MPERLTQEQRSRNMSRIRAKDTGIELSLRRALYRRGVRYRKTPSLPGKPDLAFPRARLAVFVDGCFWHHCPDHYQAPVRNAEYWKSKVARNRQRDRRVDADLANLGWTVIRIWEHEVEERLTDVVDRIESICRTGPVGSLPFSRAVSRFTPLTVVAQRQTQLDKG